MSNTKFFYWILFILAISNNTLKAEIVTIKSPNQKITVSFWCTPAGEPVYSVSLSGSIVLKQSQLGIIRSDEDFSKMLSIDSVSNESVVSDEYTLLYGKRLKCHYLCHKRIFYLKNAHSKPMEIIFQVSDDGVAFRYHFPEKKDTFVKIFKELSSFHFELSTKAFLQPCPDARTGWCFTQPSYEEYYQLELPVGTAAPYQAGWVMPALFKYENFWISITETAVDTNYCGSRLSQFSPDGEYVIQFPQPQECCGNEPYLPESILPWYTPWRIIAVSENLAGIVESTLGTDLAIPAQYDVSSWLKPGIASWSWVILKDNATVFEIQKKYIDFAAEMKWQYCLIDALWDQQIGYDKIIELADYAKAKNIKILLWYNSAGDWNTTNITPRDKLLTKESRAKEFQRLKEIGIGGIKVDFFGGDGQSMMKYYIAILNDAAKYNLAVNFHGCTYPRGWQRTYPNLVSMEAIRGEEYVTFGQYFADNQPWHCTVIPFTRNLFDPMDFTPVNFSGIPNIQRQTTKGFEIALSVLFTSGIQHMAETPEGMAIQDDFVKEYMSTIPTSWDDIKFIDGYPGKYVIIARKKGNQWYVAGINGEKSARTVTLNLSFLPKTAKGIIISDTKDSKNLVKENILLSKPVNITLQPYDGFVIKTLSK
ncbi:MAG TPA: glycoside hydrolase family 97 catalytic domain-containing protein [Bacteroidales bacterium]|nr:alpha-glucosidase [Bacteroidales bacterium]HRC89945.1 glycoside hydrolase family 97 catalytic domain-containing protein [Bacteroidales bacterium]